MKTLLITGPCAVESEEQLKSTAAQIHQEMQARGQQLDYFRAGVWKPRSNPESFSGLGEKALPWLAEIQQRYNVPVCTEVMTPHHVECCERHGITTLWVGARTAVNPNEVQQIAEAVQGKPFVVMVKNPLVPDLKLWIGNIERFLKANVKQVMAIHRGFADSNENVYRNAPCWEIPIDLKVRYPELPILCDPSHLCGHTQWVKQIAQLAMIYGFNGLMVECHCQPSSALSDGAQQLTPHQWAEMIQDLKFTNDAPNRELMVKRALLENVDTQLSALLYKRMRIVDDIARIKKEHNLPVVQPQQWQQVCERYRNSNQDAQYKDFIELFLEILHQNSIKRQQ